MYNVTVFYRDDRSPSVQAVITTWYVISFVLCITGNITILYGSIYRKAIRLDSLSVWIIRNLSGVDLLQGVINLLPFAIVNIAGNKWVFGQHSCYVHYLFRFPFHGANYQLITIMIVNKVFRCLLPLRFLTTNRRQKTIITAAMVILNGFIPIWVIVRDFGSSIHPIVFSELFSSCWAEGKQTKPYMIYNYIDMCLNIVCSGLMTLIMLICTIFLIGFAKHKTKTKVNIKNMAVVAAVALVFCVSAVPFFVWFSIFMFRGRDMVTMFSSYHSFLVFSRYALHSMQISAFINPIVYFFTIPSFRRYVVSLRKSTIFPSSNSSNTKMTFRIPTRN